MKVSRNLRVPKADSGRLRMVRVVGDGTPPNTRILGMDGEPIPEMVNAYSIQGDTEGCARGVFVYWVTDENDQLIADPETDGFLEDTFEAFVVLEKAPELSKAEPAADQIQRLAQFLENEVPGEPTAREYAIDTAIRLLRQLVEVPREGERYWSCKIGPATRDPGECGGDVRLREMVEDVFRAMFGHYPGMTSSGWGAHLTRIERTVADSGKVLEQLEEAGDSGTAREGGSKEGLEVGGIGTPDGPELDKASDAPDKCFALPRDPAGTEESGDTAFSRLAPGGVVARDPRGYKV